MPSESPGSGLASARSDREITSVANAMRLIEALGRQPTGGVSDLARDLALSKPAVDRLLSTLMSSGYVEQDEQTRRYHLTMKLVAIANSVKDRTGLIELARPRLAELAEAFHETVNLGTLHQGSIVYAATIPSQQLFRIEPVPGSEVPAYATALGKAVLAHSPEAERDRYLRDVRPVPFTRFTATSVAELRQRLDRARADGYALDDGELVEEVCCAAAPVIGGDGNAVAAVSVTTIRSTFAKSGDQIVQAVIETARAISESMVMF
ncbi:IclR family transcriptional regulator [Streptomyces sp. NPDC050560]|uniref:IclR family transcriptional regulator n=1 Tax=Streptomyces sp. NPDC050560 TaxID=3365630 RepID=UPI0037A9C175